MGQLYYWDTTSSSWLATMVGAQGPQGITGPSGPTGPTGPTGAASLPASTTATSAVTATAGQVTTCNPSTTFAVTLPASPSNGTICGVYVLAAATSYVTVAAGSGNTLDYAVGRLYKGQSAYLVYNSTTTSWVSPTQNNQQANPAGKIVTTVGTSLTNAGYTGITFDTSSFMRGGMVRNGNGITVPVTGYYQVTFTSDLGVSKHLWTFIWNQSFTTISTIFNSIGYGYTYTDIVFCTAGDNIGPIVYNWDATFTTGTYNAFSVILVNQ